MVAFQKEGVRKTMNFEELKTIVREAQKIVFFGGAGVSTDSGIPDFRGTDGLYTEDNEEYEESPEIMLSGGYLRKKPKEFYRYYKKNMLYPNAKPNGAHRALAKLEDEGKLTAVITQNIDGLHQAAGSQNVIELHGSVLRNYCTVCGREHSLSFIQNAPDVPLCEVCGAVVRPDVVLYGEGLDGEAFRLAEEAIMEADVMIVGGTSLTVYPAASLVGYFRGKHMIIINKSPTPYDRFADYVIRDSIADVLEKIVTD